MGKAFALDDQTDRIRHALRGVWHVRRQVEHFTGFDRNVAGPAILLDAQDHFTFKLVKEFGAVFVMVVAPFVRSTHNHDDVIRIDDAFIADRRLE